jgi:protein-tyrosine phosphatase
MIDLHCHILPGVDDGPRTLEEGAAMCRLAAADGCTAMIATPHQRRGSWWNDDCDHLRSLAQALQEAVGDELHVGLGGEIHVDPRLLGEVVSLPEAGVLPLAGSRYLLIELDVAGTPAHSCDLVHELSVAGWRPVVAHPELIPWLAPDAETVRRLVALGGAVQVTAMSLTGDFGRRPQQDAWRLLDAGLVHFVASDAHDTHRRPPGLQRAQQMIADRHGEDEARRLTCDNPGAVLADLPLPAPVRAEA